MTARNINYELKTQSLTKFTFIWPDNFKLNVPTKLVFF